MIHEKRHKSKVNNWDFIFIFYFLLSPLLLLNWAEERDNLPQLRKNKNNKYTNYWVAKSKVITDLKFYSPGCNLNKRWNFYW